MKHLLGKSAQALFEFFQNSENFFYSLSHNELSAFRDVPKTRIFDKSAQVRALYRGTFVGFSVETGPGIPGKYEARKSKYETNPKPE
jgi:hypothetical protein